MKEASVAGQPRVVGEFAQAEENIEPSQRPQKFSDFVGQENVCENLTLFIDAARQRSAALDHVLLSGPPGLGKTTLAQIIARELGSGFRMTSGPVVARPGDLAALLTNLEAGEVLFIDEIHRLSPLVEEILYPAMEDFQLDLMIGEGPAARSVRLNLQPFTLIGATTRAGLLTTPLRDRFGIQCRLDFYTDADLKEIVQRSAARLGIPMTDAGAGEIGKRSRGTPRIAERLLRRVSDVALVEKVSKIDTQATGRALKRLQVDRAGLDEMDRKYLRTIGKKFDHGPVGVETLAAALSEERVTIEDIIEPYLMQEGYVQRTPRGRIITRSGCKCVGLPYKKEPQQGRQSQLPLTEQPDGV